MVQLDAVHADNSAIVRSQPLVAVFFGGTSGIGHYTLRALAVAEANGGKGLRAYIVGRNAKAADDIIAECRGIYPAGQYKFVKAEDLTLIRDVNRICSEIIELEDKEAENPRIDYLMLSQGGAIFIPRKDTQEGIDKTMSLMYYSRMRAITKLMPLLLKSSLPAKVVSVFASGTEAKLFPEDLSLRDLSRYSYTQARSHMCFMHTVFLEALAEQYSGKLTLVHIFPGLVPGPGFNSPELPLWVWVLFTCLMSPPLGWLITTKPEECGSRMLSLASPRYRPQQDGDAKHQEGAILGTNGKPGSGAYSLTSNGESNYNAKAYLTIDKEELKKRVWDHTMNAFEVIEAGKVFDE